MEDGPGALTPATQVGDLEEPFGPWLPPGSVLAIVVMWGVNKWIEDPSLSVFPSL